MSSPLVQATIEEAIRERLIDSGEVFDLIGTRVYPGILSNTLTFPPGAIAFRVVSRETDELLAPPGSTGLDTTRFRFFCTARGSGAYGQAKALDKALRQRLEGLRTTIGGVFINRCHFVSGLDFYDEVTQTHQFAADYEVVAREP